MNATPRGSRRRLVSLLRPVSRVCLALALLVCAAARLEAQVTYTGGAVDFGSVTRGATPGSVAVPFSVAGGATATFAASAASSQGSLGQDFSITTQTCTGTITGPATCSITVAFAPVSPGLRTGALAVNVNGQPQTVVYLHGIGVGSQLVYSPDSASATTTVTPLQPVFYSPSAAVYDSAGNLYFNDYLNNRLLKQSTTGTLSSLGATAGGTSLSSLAISGSGVLYLTAPSQAAVTRYVAGSGFAPLTVTGASLTQPSGIAIDGNGTLYIADATANRIVRANPDGTAATVLALTGLGTGLSSPRGLAIDSANNLYIADSGNARIVKVNLTTLAAAPVTLTGALLFNAYGVAVDASGTLYIADTGNRRIVRVSTTGAATAILTPGFTFAVPSNVLVAANGDLVVADNTNGLTRVVRAAPSTTLSFTTPTLTGALDSADGLKSVTLQNIGNTALQINIPAAGAKNASTSNTAFAISGTSTCPQLTSSSALTAGQIAVGATCIYAVSFTPNAVGANTGVLDIQSTPTGLGTIAQDVPLAGTGLATLESFLITVPATATIGTPISFTVRAVSGGATSPNYTGTVTLSTTDPAATFLGGLTYTFTTADAGVHTFTAPANGLRFGTAGTFTVTARDGTVSTTSSGVVVSAAPVVANSLTLAISPNATIGAADPFTISALFNNAAATTYRGTVSFASTDPLATFPGGTNYTFTAADNGVHTFPTGIVFGTAGTYTVTVTDGTLTASATVAVAAPTKLNPTVSLGTTFGGTSITLRAVVSGTAGTPGGNVTFFDGATSLGTVTLAGGIATLPLTLPIPANHVFTARYNGDNTYNTAVSNTVAQSIGDFYFSAVTSSSTGLTATVLPGGTANYLFTVNPTTANTFTADVTFSASGYPPGSTVTFSPALIPAGSTAATPTMTIKVPALSGALHAPVLHPEAEHLAPVAFALLLLPLLSRRNRRRTLPLLLALFTLATATFGLTGCVTDQSSGYFGQTTKTYTITVTATSGLITHSSSVQLTVQ